MTDRPPIQGDWRYLLRCAHCETLWKTPPAEVTITYSPAEYDDLTLGITDPGEWISNTPCPLCGATKINLNQSAMSLSEANEMHRIIAEAKHQQREMFGDVVW